MNISRKRIVIVGGGFGGLAAARALARTPADVTLIDRTNHHLFQPLLYQVATSALNPGQIAAPIRGILRYQKNVTVIMGDVRGVDKEQRHVLFNTADGQEVVLPYDYLILATGATHSYFGHNEYEQFAPGLKNLADAVGVRNKILTAFEDAETEEHPEEHKDRLTFVLVGAGPTGVEMAGAIAVLVRQTLRREFRRIKPATARIILVDVASRVLGSFSEKLSGAAKKRLEDLGVEVLLGHGVDKIDGDGVIIAGERIASKTVIWTAGVAPSPAGKWLGVDTDRVGRVRVEKNLTVPGHCEIFVVGDTASLEQDGRPLPGVAQVAIQQGRYAGRLIHSRIKGTSTPAPFRYFDKGNMAVVAKGFAIMESGKIQLSGLIAWFAWATVHLAFLAQFSLKLSFFVQWAWAFISGGQGGARIIVKHHALESTVPETMASVPHSQIRSSTDFALVALSDPRQK
jgi:NADH dehydrogenase